MATLAFDSPAVENRRPNARHDYAVVAASLALALLLQFHLVLTRAINWDEFWYYSQIHEFVGGRLASPLQTLHVPAFAWLVALPGNGVDHILTARLAMFAGELVTLGAIAVVAAHFSDRRTGLLCALAYLGTIYTFQHGFAFRVDPIAACLSTSALLVLLKSRLELAGIAALALLLGLAGMVTIKIVLLAPAFAGVAWLRLAEAENPRVVLTKLVACAGGALAAFCLIFWLHAQGLDAPSQPAAQSPLTSGQSVVERAGGYVFSLGLPAYPQYLMAFAAKSPLQAIAIAAAPFAILKSGLSRARKVALWGMLAAGLSFIFYRNTLPYFYAFILPPMICATAPLVRLAAARYSVTFVAVALAAGPAVHWTSEPDSPIEKQRELVGAADIIFPEPVAYFDFAGMLGEFEKANRFMTTWGITTYRESGVPVMRQRMENTVVPLVLASEQEAYLTFHELLNSKGPSPYFLEADAAALRGNYLHFWGPYWLAGKLVPAGGAVHRDHFLVPGPYTVHDAAVAVNGELHSPGEVLYLDRGVHELKAEGDKPARLVWGDRLEPPPSAPPARPYWTDF